jgi:hypothetical protein
MAPETSAPMTTLASSLATVLTPAIERGALAGLEVGQHVSAVFFLDPVSFEHERQHFVPESGFNAFGDMPLRLHCKKHPQRRPEIGPHFALLFGLVFEPQPDRGKGFGIGLARAVDPPTNRATQFFARDSWSALR